MLRCFRKRPLAALGHRPVSEPLDWQRDGPGWPRAATSRFVEAAGLRWHVQTAGTGPVVLLVHGTAASTHSWRDVTAALEARATVVAMDLPGHGFTTAPQRSAGWSLAGMAEAIGGLVAVLGVTPRLVVGHSAGAAILVEAALAGRLTPTRIISINGALLPFPGVGRHLFPVLARLAFLNPLSPALLSWRATRPGVVADLLAGTGSNLTPEGVALYRRLMSDRRHVAAALNMMAAWDLAALERRLPGLRVPLTLVAALGDRAVPAEDAWRVRDRVAGSDVVTLRGLGHLAHEEDPARVAGTILDALAAPAADGAAA